MVILKKDEYNLLERLVMLSQKGMHKAMSNYLQTKYENVIVDDKYIVAIGNIPIALVAHMDTVFKYPVDNMYYDSRKGAVWSPEGLGADDRAGIFAILQIIRSGLRPSVILTTDEETGAVGAKALAAMSCPIPDLKYLIQLDRRGTNDCVFYNCGNEEFIDYVETFGFVERIGSFSDISVLMPAWKVCGVNLSIGYEDEHSVSEVLFVKPMLDTIKKVKVMLQVDIIPDFEYKAAAVSPFSWYDSWAKVTSVSSIADAYDDDAYGAHCSGCGKIFSEYELYPAYGKEGADKIKMFCPDCIVDKVSWCATCGEGFEINPGHPSYTCPDCASKRRGPAACSKK
jgi:DNA-directed RNA polymerase subunit RPC12/RpoP